MSTRDIQAHLKEIYGVDVSSVFIGAVTDSVIDKVKNWQRPLESVYLIVYLDSLVVKNRFWSRLWGAPYLFIRCFS